MQGYHHSRLHTKILQIKKIMIHTPTKIIPPIIIAIISPTLRLVEELEAEAAREEESIMLSQASYTVQWIVCIGYVHAHMFRIQGMLRPCSKKGGSNQILICN